MCAHVNRNESMYVTWVSNKYIDSFISKWQHSMRTKLLIQSLNHYSRSWNLIITKFNAHFVEIHTQIFTTNGRPAHIWKNFAIRFSACNFLLFWRCHIHRWIQSSHCRTLDFMSICSQTKTNVLPSRTMVWNDFLIIDEIVYWPATRCDNGYSIKTIFICAF